MYRSIFRILNVSFFLSHFTIFVNDYTQKLLFVMNVFMDILVLFVITTSITQGGCLVPNWVPMLEQKSDKRTLHSVFLVSVKTTLIAVLSEKLPLFTVLLILTTLNNEFFFFFFSITT